jgi:hypothetical protein
MDMPDCIEKKLRTLMFKFLWNGPDKEQRGLTYKAISDGGINIPDLRSRLIAQKCNWIRRLQSGKGIFRQAFGSEQADWDVPTTYSTPLPKPESDDYVDWIPVLQHGPIPSNFYLLIQIA